jgi:hypothetical protein
MAEQTGNDADGRAELKRNVMRRIALGRIAATDLRVTDNEGLYPVVVALEEEPLSSLLAQLDRNQGYGNVFVGMNDGRLFSGSFLPSSSAINERNVTDFGPAQIHPESTVGMFVLWAIQHPVGVKIPMPVRSSATEVQDVREMLTTS